MVGCHLGLEAWDTDIGAVPASKNVASKKAAAGRSGLKFLCSRFIFSTSKIFNFVSNSGSGAFRFSALVKH